MAGIEEEEEPLEEEEEEDGLSQGKKAEETFVPPSSSSSSGEVQTDSFSPFFRRIFFSSPRSFNSLERCKKRA